MTRGVYERSQAIKDRVADMGRKNKESPEWLKKNSESHKGIIPSEETRRKMSDAHRGLKPSEEVLKNMRKPKKSTENYHKPKSEEHKRKIREALAGRKSNAEWDRKNSEAKMGKGTLEDNPNWNGGSSFIPYCPKFNAEFLERVRAFFEYTCQLCGHVWIKGERKLAVHHENYQKNACCDEVIIPLFVPVCSYGCHHKTNYNRQHWEKHFADIINTKFGGKCYFTKEEFDTK